MRIRKPQIEIMERGTRHRQEGGVVLSRARFASLLLQIPAVAAAAQLGAARPAGAQTAAESLASWNPGPAKDAILQFVRAATDPSSKDFVPEDDRIATFDQDGTLWVEHPLYTQVVFALDRMRTLKPAQQINVKDLSLKNLEAIVAETHSGMTVEAFTALAAAWIAQARNPRWRRPYTDLVYQPMLEVMRLFSDHKFKNYIVTGGGQAFVRSYSLNTYGIEPERVIGSAGKTKYVYDKGGRADLVKEPALLLNNNLSGKAEDIYLFLGKRPHAAFGNSSGDQQMLEFTQGNTAARLMMLVLHDDAAREYAYGPARGLPDTKIGTFPQTLYDEATTQGWNVISMKQDWKRLFTFEA
jgi:hypothetical protein